MLEAAGLFVGSFLSTMQFLKGRPKVVKVKKKKDPLIVSFPFSKGVIFMDPFPTGSCGLTFTSKLVFALAFAQGKSMKFRIIPNPWFKGI